MADWYVDFSLPTNGAGTTYSGAWNVFTGTEGTSVSVGDSIWFRRVDPGDGLKLITIKSGDIKYIGWPKSGDPLYTSRPSAPRTLWDGDVTDYTYQRRNTHTAAVHVLETDNKFYRFNFYHYYTSQHVHRVIDILSKTGVKLYNCSLGRYSAASSTNYTGVIRIEDSSGIGVYDCVFCDGCGIDSNSYRVKWFAIDNSSVNFDRCSFYTRDYAQAITPSSMDTYTEISNILNNSAVVFNDCLIQSRVQNTYTGYSIDIGARIYIDSSVVIFSDVTFEFDNTTDQNNNIFNITPLFMVKAYTNANVTFTDCNYTSNSILSGLVYTYGSSNNITCNRLTIDMSPNVKNNTVFYLNDFDNVVINTVSGVAAVFDRPEHSNYLLATNDNFNSSSVTLSGISGSSGAILDVTKDIDNANDISYSNSEIFKDFRMFVQTHRHLEIDNCKFGGVVLFNKDRPSSYTTHNIWGSVYDSKIVNIKNSSFYSYPCLKLNSSYSPYFIDATIFNCEGDGSSVIVDDDRYFDNKHGSVRVVRNKGFSATGSFQATKYMTYSAMYNNQDLKLFNYYGGGHMETSEVSRTGGAGYSIKTVPSSSLEDSLIYPPPGDEAIWCRIPSSGSFTITAYVLYGCDSCSLSVSDLYFEVDLFDSNGEPYIVQSNTLLSDSSSWSESGTKVKLTAPVTVSDAQYCPIRLVLTRYVHALEVYLDPKVDVA